MTDRISHLIALIACAVFFVIVFLGTYELFHAVGSYIANW